MGVLVPELVIKGGRVVDQDGERRRRRRHRRRAHRRGRGRPRRHRRHACSTPAAASSPRARRPAHPPARAGPGRGRDHRDRQPGRGPRRLHRGRGHAQHHARPSTAPRSCSSCSTPAARRCATCTPRAPSPSVARARRWRPMAEMAALGVRIFTDDGSGVQDDRLMRRAMEYAGGLGRDPGPALRDRVAHGRRPHARGRVVVPPRHPRHPGRGRGAHGAARPRPGRAHRRAGALPAPVDRRLGRAGPGGQGQGPAGHRRGHHPPLHPHRRRGGELRPGVQGEPAAAHRRRRRRHPGRPGRRHHRRHRHRPRPAHPAGQGGAVRPGAARHARPRDGPGPGPHRARPADRADPRAALVAAGRHRRAGRAPRRPGRRGPPGQPLRDRPRRPSGWSTRPPRPAAAATPPTPDARSPAGSATPSCAANRSWSTGRRSDERAHRTRSPRRCSCWPTARSSRARPSAPPPRSPPARSCSTRCCPGYQEVITDPSYAGQIITFTYPHIGNYGVTPGRRRERPAASAGASSSATWPGAAATGAATPTSTPSCAATASPASPASTPAASPATSATPARCPARSARPTTPC